MKASLFVCKYKLATKRMLHYWTTTRHLYIARSFSSLGKHKKMRHMSMAFKILQLYYSVNPAHNMLSMSSQILIE